MTKTYDISVDEGNGQKFRIYNQTESTVRELGSSLNQTVEEVRVAAQAKVNEFSRGLVATVKNLEDRITELKQVDAQRKRDAGDPSGRVEFILSRSESGRLTGEPAPGPATAEEKAFYRHVMHDKKAGTIRRED